MTVASPKEIEIFFCYAREDENLRNELEKHLSILKQQGQIITWHDRKIGAGKEWEREIDTHLNTAHVILLLISQNFMNSDYCYSIEMKRALERHEVGTVRVIPVILRPVDWKGAPFSKLQVLPTDGKPITRWRNRDEAFLSIAEGIREAVQDFLAFQKTKEREYYENTIFSYFDVRNIQMPEDLVGKTLGTCRIESLIGEGGFGVVYLATQPHLNRQVAIKVVKSTFRKESSYSYSYDTINEDRHRLMLLRFDREAEAVARLDHPYILPLYEYQTSPLPYLVMPYVAKGSLADRIKASYYLPLPASEVATILSQVASALDYAHQQQLIHRDIKPHNLFCHHSGNILLADFGIVQFGDSDLLAPDPSMAPYTPSYASPEQHQWLKVDYRTDIYSLGIVIYELLCGKRPFEGRLTGGPFEIANQHLHTPPPAMHTFGVQVPPAIEAVVVKALAKQPEQRYQSAGEMSAAFQAAFYRNNI